MAIPILNHLDLRSASELQNAILHKTTEGSASNVEGKIIYDTGTDTIKFYNGSSWINLDGSGDIGAVTAGDGLTGGGSSGTVSLAVNVDDSSIEIDSDTVRVKASGITNAMLAGSITNAKLAGSIADSKLNQITTANKVALSSLDIDGATDIGAALADADLFIVDDGANGTERKATMSRLKTYMQNNLTFTTNTNTQLSDEQVQDIVGAMVSSNTESGITVTYQDGDGTLDFTVGTLNQDTTGNAATATALETARNFTTTGDVVIASTSFDGSANFSAAATIQSAAVEASMLNNNIISGKTALTSGLASTDELMISDAGTVKRMDVSVLQSYLQSNLTFTSNTDVDVSNANLLTRLANLESSGGASNENITIGADSGDTIVITGNLQVSGTTTTVNSTTVNLNDHNIVLDSGNSTSAVVDGAGITIEGGSGDDATFTYNASTNAFDFKLGSAFEDIKTAKVTATSLDISGDADIDGTLETDALTINGTAITEFVQDTVGAMFSGNTETRISATYVDGDGTIDLVVDDMTANDNTQLSDEQVQDIVGAMVSSNTETNITVAYQDSDGTLDFTVANAATNAKGVVELATSAETQTGTDTARAVTPDGLAARSVHATIDVSDSDFTSNLYAEITHSLGTEDVVVQLFDSSTKETVYADVARTDKAGSASTSKIKITFASAPSNDIEVMVTSIKGSTAGTVAYN